MRRQVWWTGAAFVEPPSVAEAPDVVSMTRSWWHEQGLLDPAGQIAALGWEVRTRTLGAAAGELQALLMPVTTGGFVFVVDPDPTPEQEAAGADASVVRSWRIAHEYAHTFFYVRDRVPWRARRHGHVEELFCDAYANALLGTALTSIPKPDSHLSLTSHGWS